MGLTAAALIVGNEILSGKVPESNVYPLSRELFALGFELRRVIVCPDEEDVIVEDLRALKATHDVVITSGGVGPTHDDITIRAIASAFEVPVVRSSAMEKMLRDYHGDACTEAHLRMADMPEGTRLVTTPEMAWPTLVVDNVFVFPGVPQIFLRKLDVLRQELAGKGSFSSREIYLSCDEPAVAPLLDKVSSEHPEVNLGSYLRWAARDTGGYRTKLTIDGRDPEAVERCFQALESGLDPEWLTEGPTE